MPSLTHSLIGHSERFSLWQCVLCGVLPKGIQYWPLSLQVGKTLSIQLTKVKLLELRVEIEHNVRTS
ncbi:Uncharacterised protein [Vibrio cholerae]|nr:Uncharacterised protein [Vibrio cholerae]